MRGVSVRRGKWHRYMPAIIIAVSLVLLTSLSVVVSRSHTRLLAVDGHRYRLQVADTPASRAKGLGDRTSMSDSQGMIFTFADAEPRCFWMKDMHYALDMLWLDNTQRIIKIAANVSPNTYPQTFCSKTGAQYVIELNAGQAADAHLHVRQFIKF